MLKNCFLYNKKINKLENCNTNRKNCNKKLTLNLEIVFLTSALFALYACGIMLDTIHESNVLELLFQFSEI